jgi:hypothetical protein
MGWIRGLPTGSSWPETLPVRYQLALFLPICSIVIFTVLHIADGSVPAVRGLKGRSDVDKPARKDFASSAISRLSIHSAVGVGVIGAVRASVGTQATSAEAIVARCAMIVLGAAVLFGMFAALCFAQSDRWTSLEDPKVVPPETDPCLQTKRGLIDKGTRFDQFSFYALTTGLIWTTAMYDPWLSVAANFVLGALLYSYYFDFPK